jgi:hypothetical protein
VATTKLDEDEIPLSELGCLTKPRSRLEVAGKVFWLYLLVNSREKEEEHCRIRNEKLEAHGMKPPMTRISGNRFETQI